jgi:hypothetical protein
MPETNYGNLGVTVPKGTDKPIAIPSAIKAFADSIGNGAGAGKLIIAQSIGAAKFLAMKGDATLAADGTLTLAAKPVTWYTPVSIATEETRTNVAFGLMTTPDQISGVVIPTGGTLLINYRAIWRASVANAGRVAIFVGANQVKNMGPEAQPVLYESPTSVEEFNTRFAYLESTSNGFFTSIINNSKGSASFGAVTTGLISGQWMAIEGLAAGTYNVSIQYRGTSGGVVVRERTLKAAVWGF